MQNKIIQQLEDLKEELESDLEAIKLNDPFYYCDNNHYYEDHVIKGHDEAIEILEKLASIFSPKEYESLLRGESSLFIDCHCYNYNEMSDRVTLIEAIITELKKLKGEKK